MATSILEPVPTVLRWNAIVLVDASSGEPVRDHQHGIQARHHEPPVSIESKLYIFLINALR